MFLHAAGNRLKHVNRGAALWGLFFLMALFCGVARAEPALPPTLTIAADVWCPINCDPAEAEQGIGIDLAKKLFEPLGYRINYVVVPWSRALDDVKQGKVDAVVGANNTDDPSLIFPETPVSVVADTFYMRREDAFPFKGVESLQGKRIGIIRDYGYGDEVNALVAMNKKTPGGVQVVSGDDALEQNIKKLLAGRIDVVVEIGQVMDYKLKTMGLADKIVPVGSVREEYVYLAFSPALPQSRKLAQQFDLGMAGLKKSGSLSALYAPYGIKP